MRNCGRQEIDIFSPPKNWRCDNSPDDKWSSDDVSLVFINQFLTKVFSLMKIEYSHPENGHLLKILR